MGNQPSIKSKTTVSVEGLFFGGIAQLARASALHAEGRGFKSLYLHKREKRKVIIISAAVSSNWSERRRREPEVTGSIPVLSW